MLDTYASFIQSFAESGLRCCVNGNLERALMLAIYIMHVEATYAS